MHARLYRAEAPVMISTSSFVMAACRPRLYCMVKVPIISPAFLLALSMALRLKARSGDVRQEREREKNLPSVVFAGITLDEGRVDGVGKRELGKILGEVVLVLVGGEAVWKQIRL
jgi:hypothetical protein